MLFIAAMIVVALPHIGQPGGDILHVSGIARAIRSQ